MSETKPAKRMIVEVRYVICPHCGEAQAGWLNDPRKVTSAQECDDCGQVYTIPQDIEVVGKMTGLTQDDWAELDAAVQELRYCVWTEDQCGNWWTGCGNGFAIAEGTPVENGFRYCLYCGRKLQEKRRPI